MNNLIQLYSQQTAYAYIGKLDKTDFPYFIQLCKMNKQSLKKYLVGELKKIYTPDTVIVGDGYIYVKGSVPVLLTAHMDTVHKETIKHFYEDNSKGNHKISSPQGIGGDDRCGIYMILQIIKEHKCSVLFCEDEEIGGVGSKKFCQTNYINDLSQLKYLIELDRKGNNDAVFYDCDNKKFTKFITDNTGYIEAYGSFSDISNLAPASKIAAVNLSCGYYNAHTLSEFVVMEETLHTIEVVNKLISVECEQFEYVKKTYQYYGNALYCGDYYGEYYKKYYSSCSNKKKKKNTQNESTVTVSICAMVNQTDFILSAKGKTEFEAWYNLFVDNPNICYNDIYDYDILKM